MDDEERQRYERMFRAMIGRDGVAVHRGYEMLVHIDDFVFDEKGWSAVLSSPEREPYRIGHFPWNDDDFPWHAEGSYWHFPYLSERYMFSPDAVRRCHAATATTT